MYISVINGNIGFKVDGVHEILDTDIAISKEIYDRFFMEQSQGKQFRILNINGSTFNEIFEEIIPEPIPLLPTTEERLSLLETAMNDLLLGGI